MVFAAFAISTVGILLALGMIQGAQRAARDRARTDLEAELATFLDAPSASDADHGAGTYQGMPVTIELGHYAVTFSVELPPAIVPYRELLARHGRAALQGRLHELGVSVGGDDVASGSIPREPGLAENLVSIANRMPAIVALRDLRRFAPGELLTRIERAHSSAEIDQVLMDLTKHFPDAPETQDAIDLAAEREHGHPERVRERAQRWLQNA